MRIDTVQFVYTPRTNSRDRSGVKAFSGQYPEESAGPASGPPRSVSGPLHLLVDSTGTKFSGEGEWQVCKHGASRRHQWRKIHIGIDAETLEVRAAEMTSNRIGDVPILPDLLAQIPAEDQIGSVTADGIHDTKGFPPHRGSRGRCHHTTQPKCQGLEGSRSRPAGAK